MQPTPGIPVYDAAASVAAFPLGGVGTGNVSLGARGDLRDWEIFNVPAKGQDLPNTFFAIRMQAGDAEPIARVIEGPLPPPHARSHGYHPSTSAGLPRFASSTLRGEYPLVTVNFDDPTLPVRIQLEAFTPFVPLDAAESGIPCALLNYTVTNTSDQPLSITLVGSLINPVGGVSHDPYGNFRASRKGRTHNEARSDDGLQGLYLHAADIASDDLDYGSMALVTDHPTVTIKRNWRRGAWFDYLRDFWNDFTADGLLDDDSSTEPSPDGRADTGSLGVVDTLAPGASATYRFILTWYFPNRENGWRTGSGNQSHRVVDEQIPPVTRNHYATRFDDAWHVACYVHAERDRLDSQTHQFHDALFSSTLPPVVLDAVSANIVPIRSTTCFWLEDGKFYGWEGCFDDDGCCPGTCTHVWAYAQTAAFLFPSLERVMREIEFEIETEPDGYMNFRTFKPFGAEFVWQWGDQKPEAAVDGQMGSILRVYREWQLSGDNDWLARLWEPVKHALGFADVQWDLDRDGVLDGRQHNTYDIEFFGPNPLSSIYYLAALRAVEQMAHVLNEPETAERCRTAFERGSQRLDDLLWNGEYYIQRLDDVDAHPYQHGLGCLSDQMLGQLHARVLGLGDLLPADRIRAAVGSIFKYNFREGFGDHVNCQRTYVLNDESGLLLCTWPHGGEPRFPFVYSDEVWTGIEYQVAAHLIYEGWLDEGLRVVEAARARHDGVRRNPWNEVECGHHYARSMASWAVLLALTGAQVDPAAGELRFKPVRNASTETDEFRTFWSSGRAWGTLRVFRDVATGEWQHDVTVVGGALDNLRVVVDYQ